MKWTSILGCIALIGADLSPAAANAARRTYSYAIVHPLYGTIGSFDRSSDTAAGITRAEAHLKVVVKILGLVVHRETADQTEVWRGSRLMSFQSLTTTNGSRLVVGGVASDDHFLVSSPSGIAVAPADVVASDPWSLNRMGPGVVVSIRTGTIYSVKVTGGEAERVTLHGGSAPARHYHVNTAAEPNKWEVWVDQAGVPVKFRSLEHGAAVDFVLVSSPPPADDLARPLAQEGTNGSK